MRVSRARRDLPLGPWGLVTFPEGEGPKIYAEITGSRFARFTKYQEDLFARESFKATFDEVCELVNRKFPSNVIQHLRLTHSRLGCAGIRD